MSNIYVDDFFLGINSFIHPSAVIRGINGNAKKVVIGDNCYIGESVQIIIDEFTLGDYSKIQHHTNIHGYKPCYIGHNAWVGQYTIIDSIGGVKIGNNCGIGAHSQLWSHIKYGDIMEGCNFLSEKELLIEDDVWLVGHCIVSPVHIKSKSMAMVGAVVTKDMEFNQIYAGAPAKSISEKIGCQFRNVTLDEKLRTMHEYLLKYTGDKSKIKVVTQKEQIDFIDDISYFNVSDRKYKKTASKEEIFFMHFLLPEKAKFTPY